MQEMFNKDLEEIKKSQSIVNNAITEIKSTLRGNQKQNRGRREAEERISEVENRIVEISEAERKTEKRIKRIDNFRDLQDNVKHPNIQTLGVPEEENKKKGKEKTLEEVTVEKFPKMGKEIATQVQETQRVLNRINPRRNTTVQFSLVAQLCPTLCDPMDYST